MTEHIEVKKVANYVHLTFSGPFTIQGSKRAIDVMVAACTRETCMRVLFDVREMTGAISLMDRFNTVLYGVLKTPAAMRTAFVARPDQSSDKFFENAAVNRGLRLRVFHEPDDAVRWLESA